MVLDDCKKIQKMIVPFDKGELSLDDEERFVRHIENCVDCREEFEIHYIIEYALNDDSKINQSDRAYTELLEKFDFKGLVDLKLENSTIKTTKQRTFNDFVNFCFNLCNVLLIFSIILYVLIYFHYY